MTRLFVNHALIGMNVLKLCHENQSNFLGWISHFECRTYEKAKTKMFHDYFQTLLKTKRANLKVSQSGNLSMGHWSNKKSTDNKAEANAQITKISMTTKVKQFFWIFVVFKVFQQSSKWVPNSISLCDFLQCCPLRSYIGELMFQLIHLYFWSEYFCMWKSPKF